MTIEELTQIATDFLRENYDIELKIPIVRNNRLRRSMGRYLSTYEDEPVRLEVAGFTIQYAHRDVIIDTLKHECVHYALHQRGEPFDDGHPHFESELRRLGVGSTESCTVGTYVVYVCGRCGKEAKSRGKRLLREHKRRITRCCRDEIVIVGERIYNGTEAI